MKKPTKQSAFQDRKVAKIREWRTERDRRRLANALVTVPEMEFSDKPPTIAYVAYDSVPLEKFHNPAWDKPPAIRHKTLEDFGSWARKNLDPHRQKASDHFNVPYDEVTPEQRAMGKALNYAEAYGVPVSRIIEGTPK